MRVHLQLVLGIVLLAGFGVGAAPPSEAVGPGGEDQRGWIQGFKTSPKGPFESVIWFCKDGTQLPPRPYACADHGGGVQHGTWNERAVALRERGYAVANVLSTLDPNQFVGAHANLDLLKQILLERFLIGWDDGWIFRGARSYRGALQAEDEEKGAHALMLTLLRDPAWQHSTRFQLLREAVRLLPLRTDLKNATQVRQAALMIAEKDPKFTSLRAKIHSVPDAEDAKRVREYAKRSGQGSLAKEYEELAASIDQLYSGGGGAKSARALADVVSDPELAGEFRAGAERLMGDLPPSQRLEAAARMMALIRKNFDLLREPELALQGLKTSIALETEAYAAANTLLGELEGTSRRERLNLLVTTAEALYGAGLITGRHVSGVLASVQRLEREAKPLLNRYREELRYLSLAPEWSARWLEFHFGPVVGRWAAIEPEARLYAQDRLRGSPLLFYGAVVDELIREANQLAGIEHELFGQRVGAGLRALNPGLARGVLRTGGDAGEFQRDGIYILPETTADLPPVAGILTQGEGSSLSHIQLLARNLGIPNVVVGDELLEKVKARQGSAVVLAVSPHGVVQLVDHDARWDEVFGAEKESGSGVVIRPNLKKLNLSTRDFILLSDLRASDSGKTSGPKGANLGELKHHFRDQVPNGFVVPFGIFRALLDQPLESGGPAVFEWMKERYAAIAEAPSNSDEQRKMISDFLSRLRSWIENVELDESFRTRMSKMLQKTFGDDGSYGVFVRSDTNVEDLPGFTGAGLNLTVPNVVGQENILIALRRVWASPFTERAYGWRQAHMEQPEYVFPAVVIQRALPSDKSGVMVTVDVDSGSASWLSIAVNEGVGGAVDGQASESLRIPLHGGKVRYLAQATAPQRAILNPNGGITHAPASGTSTVLSQDEIMQLVSLTHRIQGFPSLQTENDQSLPADIEFAFVNGHLALLQIRPFVESKKAQSSAYLSGLDADFRERGQIRVALEGPSKDSSQASEDRVPSVGAQ